MCNMCSSPPCIHVLVIAVNTVHFLFYALWDVPGSNVSKMFILFQKET